MTVDISERAFEDAIERALLHIPDEPEVRDEVREPVRHTTPAPFRVPTANAAQSSTTASCV